MGSNSKGIAWVGNVFQKFEEMCLEVEEIMWQDGLKYVEDKLQTVGENVKQICSGVVQDVFAELSVVYDATNNSESATYDTSVQDSKSNDSSVQDSKSNESLGQESILAHKILKEVMDEDKLEQELHNALECNHPSIDDNKVEQHESSLVETNVAEIIGKTNVCTNKDLSDMRQDRLEISDIITREKKYDSKLVSEALIDAAKYNSLAQSSDFFVVPDTTSTNVSNSSGKLDSLINVDSNKMSSGEAKLVKGRVKIGDSDLYYGSQEALRRRSCKEKLKDVFTKRKKKGAQKLDHQQQQDATSHVSLSSASKGQDIECSASSSLTTPIESSEFDWEMV